MSRVPEEAVALHRRNNRQSATCWEQFADHRARVTDLALATSGGRLAVLGAGNCNDVDLPELRSRFGEIHLIDIDAESLHRARARQLPETAAALVLRAPVDASGAMTWLLDLRGSAPTDAAVARLPEMCATNVADAAGCAFDTALSACVLSQIMHSVGRILGAAHPDLVRVRAALAIAHARSLARLVKPGGAGILVTDVCSSILDPALEERFSCSGGAALLRDHERDGVILSGTAPSVLLDALEGRAGGPALVSAARLVEPWLWRMGPLVLLVYAIVFTRSDAAQ